MENRPRSFKNCSKTVDEMRNRRHDETVELRKSKKGDQLNEHRNIDTNATSPLKEYDSPVLSSLYTSLDNIMEDIKDETNVMWLMSNLCPEKNPKNEILAVLAKLLQHNDSFGQLLSNAAWAIVYFTQENSENIQKIFNVNCVPSLIRMLGHAENLVVLPSLRCIGNIVTGTDAQVTS